MISVKNLKRSFSTKVRPKGFVQHLRSLIQPEWVTKTALDAVSFQIEAGESVGFIGPNGAGKSTTIKLLTGILVPDSGEVSVLGKNPWKQRKEVVQQIGVVFGQRTQLWWDLPVIDSFQLLRDIFQVPNEQYQTNLEELVETLNLKPFLEKPARELSLGQRVRCDIAASLIHSPQLLFLDEPTIGLDTTTKTILRSFLRNLNRQRKMSLFLTTHDMDDVTALCDRILVVDQGKLHFDGPLSELHQQNSHERCLVVELEEDAPWSLENSTKLIQKQGTRVWIRYDSLKTPTTALLSEVVEKYQVKDLFVETVSTKETIGNLFESLKS